MFHQINQNSWAWGPGTRDLEELVGDPDCTQGGELLLWGFQEEGAGAAPTIRLALATPVMELAAQVGALLSPSGAALADLLCLLPGC